jgi:hypothetical protein
MLTTRLPRLLLPLVLFLVWTPVAYAWSWPVSGPVLQPFSYDSAHPYAAGQHRGIDIGADAAGQTVVAPAAGTVSFAGTVPANGRSVTIQTQDGYSVTLTHLGSTVVATGQVLAEQDPVGTIGPSGTPEEDGPYVHLGIRVTTDPDGYLDPLSFLPPAATGGSTDDPAPSQPSSSGTTSASPAPESTPAVATRRGSPGTPAQSHVSHDEDSRAQQPRSEIKTRTSMQRPAVRSVRPTAAASHPVQSKPRHFAEPESFVRRPVVETAAPIEPAALDSGHELRPSASPSPHPRSTGLLPLLLNGAAALIAVAAALRAGCGRRRRLTESAQVLHLRRRLPEQLRPASRAA